MTQIKGGRSHADGSDRNACHAEPVSLYLAAPLPSQSNEGFITLGKSSNEGEVRKKNDGWDLPRASLVCDREDARQKYYDSLCCF